MTTLTAQERERLVQSGLIATAQPKRKYNGRPTRTHLTLAKIEDELREKLMNSVHPLRTAALNEALEVVRGHFKQ